jgi:hypothetical protein
MKNEDERVALQAVEFWSTVCDEEIELANEALEVIIKIFLCVSLIIREIFIQIYIFFLRIGFRSR